MMPDALTADALTADAMTPGMLSSGMVSMVLIWGGVGGLLGLMAYRFARGAWSLEDEDIPAVSSLHRVLAWLAVLAAAAGLVLFVRDWHGMG